MLVVHGGAGKVACCSMEHDRFGKVNDGNTTTDYDPEEIKKKISINTAIAP